MIGLQLQTIKDALLAWAQGNNAPVVVAGDLEDMITRLQETPSAPRVVCAFHHQDKRGEFEESGMVDRFFWVAIARAKGLKIEPGANLMTGTAGGKPLFLLFDESCQIIRNLNFDPAYTEGAPNYRGGEPLTVNGYTMTDVLRHEFSIGTQLPAVNVTDPTNPLNLTQE